MIPLPFGSHQSVMRRSSMLCGYHVELIPSCVRLHRRDVRMFSVAHKSSLPRENKIDHGRGFMDWLGQRMGVKSLEDWYEVSSNELEKNGGSGLLNMYGRFPAQWIHSLYPEHPWNFERL